MSCKLFYICFKTPLSVFYQYESESKPQIFSLNTHQ
ncbi:hypothetical protein N197_02705 [Helicobacter pylori UM023]|nr:hypothetical protein N197_02705 [Helicobacter pylori UM023]